MQHSSEFFWQFYVFERISNFFEASSVWISKPFLHDIDVCVAVCFESIASILAEAGLGMEHVVRFNAYYAVKKKIVNFFAKFFKVFAKFFKVFASFLRFSRAFRGFRIHSDPLGCIRIHLEAIGSVWAFWNFLDFFFDFWFVFQRFRT